MAKRGRPPKYPWRIKNEDEYFLKASTLLDNLVDKYYAYLAIDDKWINQ